MPTLSARLQLLDVGKFPPLNETIRSRTETLSGRSLFIQSRDSFRLYQLWVKAAVSVIGPPIVIELGLAVPEKEPVPLPVQPLKL